MPKQPPADGDDPGPGFLWGLPVVIKDANAVRGVAWAVGSPLLADRVADYSDNMVARIERSGGIVMGKSNTPEFCAGSNSFNDVYGTTRNPHFLPVSAGGSFGTIRPSAVTPRFSFKSSKRIR